MTIFQIHKNPFDEVDHFANEKVELTNSIMTRTCTNNSYCIQAEKIFVFDSEPASKWKIALETLSP